MGLLEKGERTKLRLLLENNDANDVLHLFADLISKKWQEQSALGDTEFETIKLTAEKEYKCLGVKEFLSLMEQECFEDQPKLEPEN